MPICGTCHVHGGAHKCASMHIAPVSLVGHWRGIRYAHAVRASGVLARLLRHRPMAVDFAPVRCTQASVMVCRFLTKVGQVATTDKSGQG